MSRPLAWLVGKLGASTLLTLALLLLVLASVALGLSGVVRGLDPGLLLPLAILGLLVGWGLAWLPLPGWAAAVLACGLGVEMLVLRVARLGGALLALAQALASLVLGVRRWPLDGQPDPGPARLALAELWAGLGILLVRLRDWLQALAAGRPAFDPVAAALVWGMALWAVAAWAGWAVRRRRQPLPAVTPAAVVLAFSLAYADAGFSILLPVLGATLILLVLVGHDARERRWQAAGIDFSLDIRLDLALAAIVLSWVLVAAAWAAPSISVRQLASLMRRFSVEPGGGPNPLAGSLGLESASGSDTALRNMRVTGLPRGHLVGSGPELSREVVMRIATGDLPPGPPEAALGRSPPRYYWRSVTYDRYISRGWATDSTRTIAYRAGEPAAAPESPAGRAVDQYVEAARDLGEVLYAAGTLVTVDHNYHVAWRSAGDAFGATVDATDYRAESVVPQVSEAQLRSAGSDYPVEMRDRYLALPDDVPARVLGLARDLTATAPTPYDRARAIEAYLRTFPYTLDVPRPPAGRDIADYFLFDLRRGYCDYYATAMVVLARATGLPARLVIGYASGTYDWPTARYVVTEADAHSWPEIYFPGYGWVEFEPTAGLAEIDRPAGLPTTPMPPSRAVPAPVAAGWGALSRAGWLVLPGILIVLLLSVSAWWLADLWRLRRLSSAGAVTLLYERLYRRGQQLALPLQPGDTPYEVAGLLAARLAVLAQDGRWSRLLAPAAQEVRSLADLSVQALYSPRPPDIADREQALHTWRRLDRRLWLARLRQWLQRR